MINPIKNKRETLRKALILKMDSFEDLDELAGKITEEIEKEEPESASDPYEKLLLILKYAYISGYVDGATSKR